MGGVPINNVTSVKYLGVTLTNRLRWYNHINNVYDKALKALHLGAKLTGKTWGLQPKLAGWIYTGMVKPIVQYGCMVLAHAARPTTPKLVKLSRLACLMIAPAIKSCPTSSMEVLLNLPPLAIDLQTCAIKSALGVWGQEGLKKKVEIKASLHS